MKIKKSILICIIVIAIFAICLPIFVVASSNTHDYGEIHSLSTEYSYGTLIWMHNTEMANTDNITYLYQDTINKRFGVGVEAGKNATFRLNNCSIDKDGDICDVEFTLSNVKKFKNVQPTTNSIGAIFGEEKTDPVKAVVSLRAYNYQGLIQFWLDTNAASATYKMTYYKAGTSNLANIPYTVSTVYDIDASVRSYGDYAQCTNELFQGNEGVLMPRGNIYYDKTSANKYLIDATEGIGVRTPNIIRWFFK